jgi:hypothetical protein
MEMQYGSRANISHQPPGGRDFVDLRLFPRYLNPPPNPTNISRLREQLVLAWEHTHTHTKARNRLTTTSFEKLVAIRANFKLFEPANELPSTRLESDSEDEASEFDVQDVDIEEVQGDYMET